MSAWSPGADYRETCCGGHRWWHACRNESCDETVYDATGRDSTKCPECGVQGEELHPPYCYVHKPSLRDSPKAVQEELF